MKKKNVRERRSGAKCRVKADGIYISMCPHMKGKSEKKKKNRKPNHHSFWTHTHTKNVWSSGISDDSIPSTNYTKYRQRGKKKAKPPHHRDICIDDQTIVIRTTIVYERNSHRSHFEKQKKNKNRIHFVSVHIAFHRSPLLPTIYQVGIIIIIIDMFTHNQFPHLKPTHATQISIEQ